MLPETDHVPFSLYTEHVFTPRDILLQKPIFNWLNKKNVFVIRDASIQGIALLWNRMDKNILEWKTSSWTVVIKAAIIFRLHRIWIYQLTQNRSQWSGSYSIKVLIFNSDLILCRQWKRSWWRKLGLVMISHKLKWWLFFFF